MAPNKIIIDTDPGVDDILAILLALSATPDELQIAMLSVTYGNVELQSCLRNVVALFQVLGKELAWRKSTGRPEGYETMKAHKPIVALGPEHSLEDEILMLDYFHGKDGLHNVHDVHPHLDPSDTWRLLFHGDTDPSVDPDTFSPFFTPSKTPSHLEMLRILKEEPADTVSILSLGPLTNVALAAATDPETFLRVKELVVMGGAVHVPGNVTPFAEFNCHADAVAAARVYALTSLVPLSTMPPIPEKISSLPPYPAKLSRPLRLVLVPLDITLPHEIQQSFFAERAKPLVEAGSPLAQWMSYIMTKTFAKVATMEAGDDPALSLHDPLTVWYALTRDSSHWALAPPEDIRVETSGQWTSGMHVVDKRNRLKLDEAVEGAPEGVDTHAMDEGPGDHGGWLSFRQGNRLNRIIESPGATYFKEYLMDRVFQK